MHACMHAGINLCSSPCLAPPVQSQNAVMDFTQDDILDVRVKIVADLLRLKVDLPL